MKVKTILEKVQRFGVTILPLSQIFYFDGFGIQYSQINGSELMGSQIF